MTKTSKITYFFIAIVFFIVFDIYFSELILNSLISKVGNNSIINLVSVQNSGAAFSILQDSNLFLIIFSVLALCTILFYSIKNAEKFSTFAAFWTAMLVSGISCNLYERITFGYVRDFFDLQFINFPIFNISDIFINVGVLAIIIIIIKNKYLKK